jgi:hypothetical protein
MELIMNQKIPALTNTPRDKLVARHVAWRATLIATGLLLIAVSSSAWADVTTNRRVYLKLNETTGVSAPDSTSYEQDGTLAGGASFNSSGFMAYGVECDGTNGRIEVPPQTWTDGATNFTVTFWLWADSRADFEQIVAKFASNFQRFGIEFGGSTTGGNDDIVITMHDGANRLAHTSGNHFANNRWTHVAVVFDGSGATNSDRLKVYIDGSSVSLTFPALDVPGALFTSASDGWWFGWRDDSPATYALDGKLDEIQLHARSLSASDVAEAYAHRERRLYYYRD